MPDFRLINERMTIGIGRVVFIAIFMAIVLLDSYCFTVGIINDSQQQELIQALNRASGCYSDTQRAKLVAGTDASLEKTVIVTLANDGYTSHLHNFKCFLERLGLKFVVISLNKNLHEYALKHNFISFHPQTLSTTHSKLTTWGSSEFNVITKVKKKIVADIISLGYHVLFSDIDIAFVKDPIPYVLIPGIDYLHSTNARCRSEKFNYKQRRIEGNTGFYFLRSTPASIQVWKKAVETIQRLGNLDDQSSFWNHFIYELKDPIVDKIDSCSVARRQQGFKESRRSLHNQSLHQSHMSSDNLVFRMCPLSECVFTSGMLSPSKRDDYFATRSKFVTVHANFQMSYDKQKMMADYGYWLATESSRNEWDGPCQPLKLSSPEDLKGGYSRV